MDEDLKLELQDNIAILTINRPTIEPLGHEGDGEPCGCHSKN